MLKIIYILVVIVVVISLAQFFIKPEVPVVDEVVVPEAEVVACTKDAMMCPDGSYVGRSGPDCQFICPALPEVSADVQAHIAEKADMIILTVPAPNTVAMNPFLIQGKARGNWFFEASFPVTLTNWDGLIIAEGVATAEGEWMTEEFVPFSANLEYQNPYKAGDPDFMKRGSLILKKDNPSGLPEHDDALEIPIFFASE
jgi:hypothetical protein